MLKLMHTENIYHLFYFLHLLLLLYLEDSIMIYLFLNLFYEGDNLLAQHFQI